MKRFMFCLVAILFIACIALAAGCNWEHDEWMELVNSVDETKEYSVAVNEAVPKLNCEILLADSLDPTLYIKESNDRSHILYHGYAEEVDACWRSNISIGFG